MNGSCLQLYSIGSAFWYTFELTLCGFLRFYQECVSDFFIDLDILDVFGTERTLFFLSLLFECELKRVTKVLAEMWTLSPFAIRFFQIVESSLQCVLERGRGGQWGRPSPVCGLYSYPRRTPLSLLTLLTKHLHMYDFIRIIYIGYQTKKQSLLTFVCEKIQIKTLPWAIFFKDTGIIIHLSSTKTLCHVKHLWRWR